MIRISCLLLATVAVGAGAARSYAGSPLGPYFPYDPTARMASPPALMPGSEPLGLEWWRGEAARGTRGAAPLRWNSPAAEQAYYGGGRYAGGRYYTNQHFTHGHGPRPPERTFNGTRYSSRR